MSGNYKDKDRLYLTLSHRFDKPGYFYAILLAPKDPTLALRGNDGVNGLEQLPDSTRWDVMKESGSSRLRFRKEPFNQFNSASLIARVCLAKYDSTDRMKNIASLSSLLETVPIRQNDPSFTTEEWALSVVQALAHKGFIQLKISANPDSIGPRSRAFADEVVTKIQKGQIDIAAGGVSAIPVLDLRK